MSGDVNCGRKGPCGSNSGVKFCEQQVLLLWRQVFLGVFVTREHVRHNKSGITHRGKTRISH
jgi:hypothetical protein